MNRKLIRTAGISLALCAGLGLSGLALATGDYTSRQPDVNAISGPVIEGDFEQGYSRWYMDKGEFGTVAEDQGFAVVVIVEDGVISEVKVVDGDISESSQALLEAIVEDNGTENVEAVDEEGEAILAAAEASIERARVHVSRGTNVDRELIAQHQAADAAGIEDGNYVGVYGDASVIITLKGGKLVAAITLTHGGEADAEELEEYCHEVVVNNGTEGIEAEGEFVDIAGAIDTAIDHARK